MFQTQKGIWQKTMKIKLTRMIQNLSWDYENSEND